MDRDTAQELWWSLMVSDFARGMAVARNAVTRPYRLQTIEDAEAPAIRDFLREWTAAVDEIITTLYCGAHVPSINSGKKPVSCPETFPEAKPDTPTLGTWAWACEQLLAGKKVRKESWQSNDGYYFLDGSGLVQGVKGLCCKGGMRINLTNLMLEYTGWLLYEKAENE